MILAKDYLFDNRTVDSVRIAIVSKHVLECQATTGTIVLTSNIANGIQGTGCYSSVACLHLLRGVKARVAESIGCFDEKNFGDVSDNIL